MDLLTLIFLDRTFRVDTCSRHMQTKIFSIMSTTEEQYLNKHCTNKLILKIVFKDNYVTGRIYFFIIVCGCIL
jgi:hypothetical protein